MFTVFYRKWTHSVDKHVEYMTFDRLDYSTYTCGIKNCLHLNVFDEYGIFVGLKNYNSVHISDDERALLILQGKMCLGE